MSDEGFWPGENIIQIDIDGLLVGHHATSSNLIKSQRKKSVMNFLQINWTRIPVDKLRNQIDK